jgi:3'(2'), 5'-bisphosphate nucleotidase
MNKPLESYHYVAIRAAIAASKEIMEIYSTDFSTEFKNDGSPLTKADRASSDCIQKMLAETDIPITSEETIKEDYSVRRNWEFSWCVDPLDGTKEFVKRNGEFVVNIALIQNQQPVFGVIASPVAKNLIFGGIDFGAFYLRFEELDNPAKWQHLNLITELNEPLVLISSRSHFSGDLGVFVESLKSQFPNIATAKMGSALKFFDLVKGTADVYPRFAPTMEWDIAAGHAIYLSVGGDVRDVKLGKPLKYNKENLLNPEFIAYKKSAFRNKGIKVST